MPKNRSDQVEVLLGLALSHRIPSGPCPSPEELAALFEGGLDPACQREVQDHVAACEYCYPLWLGIVETADAEPNQTTGAAVTRRTGLWSSLRHWVAAPPGALLGASLAGVLAGVLLLVIWKPWPVDFSERLEQGYQTFADLRQGVSSSEDFPWQPETELRSKGFELWEGNVWERRDPVRRSFAAGVKAGLEQATPMTPFWQNLIASLPTHRPACQSADEECQRLATALFNTGRWAALIAIACQTPSSARADGRQAPLWEAFWKTQSAALLQLRAELGDLPQTHALHELILKWLKQSTEGPQPLLCGLSAELLRRGLDGK